MTKSELVQRLSEQYPHLSHQQVALAVETIFCEIIESLSRGERVEIRGFGSFQPIVRDARLGRNPRNGDPVKVERKQIARFRLGKNLFDRLNPATNTSKSRTTGA